MRHCAPSSWDLIEYIGLPKSKNVSCLEEFRWLAKLSVFWKWFQRSWVPHYRSYLVPRDVRTFGFRKGQRCGDITDALREMLVKCTTWGRPVYICALDVRFAFDSIDHLELKRALTKTGMPIHLIVNLMRAISGKQAVIKIPYPGRSEPFEIEKGGKQGGVETPDEFNALLEYGLEPVMQSWTFSIMG